MTILEKKLDIFLLFIVDLTVTLLQQAGLVSQPLRHRRYHGSALPAAILRDEEGDVTLGGEEAHRRLELLAETTRRGEERRGGSKRRIEREDKIKYSVQKARREKLNILNK